MIKIAAIAALVLLAGCGAASRPQPNLTPASVPDPAGSRDPRPLGTPPHAGPASPPPAWVQTRQRSRWLAFGSYCWSAPRRSACADMAGTELRHDVPTVLVRPGERVRFHLAFIADSVDVYLGRSTNGVLHRRKTNIVAWRAPSGRGDRLVMLEVSAPAAGGSASYLVRLRAP